MRAINPYKFPMGFPRMAISMRAWFALVIMVSALLMAGCAQTQAPAPGSDRDAHGCIPSAGYSWCDSKQKCLREWEENCTAPVQNTTPTVVPAVVAPCADTHSVQTHDLCWASVANKQKNITACDGIYQIDARDACILPFVTSDPAVCSQLNTIPAQDNCTDRVAHALNQSAMCAKLQDITLQRNCYIDLNSPCAIETTPNAVASCEAMRKHDPALCLDDVCRFNYAQTTQTIDACDMIKADRVQVLSCKATVMQDPTYCTGDNLSSRADYCYELTAEALNDSSWCSYGQLGSLYRDDCYEYFAILTKNPDTCKYAYLETSRDNCYINYSINVDAPAACENVINSLNRNKCYIHTALQRGDPSACNGLMGKDKTSCYNLVVTGSVPIRDVQACMAIDNTEVWQPICLRNLAVQKKDSSICDLITSASYQSECKAKLS